MSGTYVYIDKQKQMNYLHKIIPVLNIVIFCKLILIKFIWYLFYGDYFHPVFHKVVFSMDSAIFGTYTKNLYTIIS